MNSFDILENAKVLFDQVENNNDESMIRTVVSRAYYSVFHGALELFDNKYDWPIDSGLKAGVHEKLYSRFDNHDFSDKDKIKTIAKIKSKLIILKKQRVKADYKLDLSITSLDARYILSEVEIILSELKSI